MTLRQASRLRVLNGCQWRKTLLPPAIPAVQLMQRAVPLRIGSCPSVRRVGGAAWRQCGARRHATEKAQSVKALIALRLNKNARRGRIRRACYGAGNWEEEGCQPIAARWEEKCAAANLVTDNRSEGIRLSRARAPSPCFDVSNK